MIHFCILTHGEEEVFRLLDSLAGRSIYVVDDESNGGYLDRLHWKCTKVFKRKLNKDFAAQRNFIHQEVPVGDWICWLDSDEEIFSSTFIPALHSAIRTGCDSISICRINTILKNGRLISVLIENHVRAYVNNGNIKWEGRLHEWPVGFLKTAFPPWHTVQVNHCKDNKRWDVQKEFYSTFK